MPQALKNPKKETCARDETIKTVFSGYLRRHRKAKDKKQYEMAERLDISPRTYSLLETGKLMPGFATVIRLCAILDMDLNGFLNNLYFVQHGHLPDDYKLPCKE
jgi:transcriptional regulator with XRE-family HTH domain